jgi:hypothetical protein
MEQKEMAEKGRSLTYSQFETASEKLRATVVAVAALFTVYCELQ